MNRHFDREIEQVKELLLRMGAMVEDQISESIRALLDRDSDLAQKVIGNDTAIDQMELDIDQPSVGAAIKITPELERIADLAVDVCERAMELNAEPPLKPLLDIPRLARMAQDMVRQGLDAFVRRDAALAR